jgi:hypothetical protein
MVNSEEASKEVELFRRSDNVMALAQWWWKSESITRRITNRRDAE